ncbi:MAG: DJ-1/PfpI family protein [Candidatus Altiarchaeota archaeon]|nr:DJ-1/PfpI family protein [Candidatus Altiarchaeota archaeon]
MKALMILSPKNFRDEEYRTPALKLERAGITVHVAGPTSGPYTGMLGKVVTPDLTLDQVNVDDYSAIVVIGGSGSKDYLWSNNKLISIINEAFKKNKTIAGICMSAPVLAKAGVLKGKNATTFASGECVRLLQWNGANYIKKGVVVDGKIVTAEGPTNADEFADAIIATLSKEKEQSK